MNLCRESFIRGQQNAVPSGCFLFGSLVNIVLVVIFVPQLSCSGLASTNQNSAFSTNLEVMTRLTQEIAQGLVRDSQISPDDTCSVLFARPEDYQFLEHAFIEGVRRFCPVVVSPHEPSHASITFEMQSSRAMVRYDNMFRAGLFGEKKVERSISVELSAKVLKNPSGEPVFAGLKEAIFQDTVAVKAVELLSSPGIRATYANVPPETFFDRIVEPFVIVGTIGVLMYLFFTIRS